VLTVLKVTLLVRRDLHPSGRATSAASPPGSFVSGPALSSRRIETEKRRGAGERERDLVPNRPSRRHHQTLGQTAQYTRRRFRRIVDWSFAEQS